MASRDHPPPTSHLHFLIGGKAARSYVAKSLLGPDRAFSCDPQTSAGTSTPAFQRARILLSDGANSVGDNDPLAAADRAATLGVPIYTIALGTPNGRITVTDPNTGQDVTLDVPPDTQTLQQIAEKTGGKAFDAPTAEQLKSVYADLQSRIGYTDEVQEVTFLLVAAGLVLVVIGAGASALWFGRLP